MPCTTKRLAGSTLEQGRQSVAPRGSQRQLTGTDRSALAGDSGRLAQFGPVYPSTGLYILSSIREAALGPMFTIRYRGKYHSLCESRARAARVRVARPLKIDFRMFMKSLSRFWNREYQNWPRPWDRSPRLAKNRNQWRCRVAQMTGCETPRRRIGVERGTGVKMSGPARANSRERRVQINTDSLRCDIAGSVRT
jgi:hypothetical protein